MRTTKLLLIVMLAAVLLAGGTQLAEADRPGPPSVDLAVAPDTAAVEATPCGSTTVQVSMTNGRDKAVYTDVYVTADPALLLRQRVISTYIPANDTVTATLEIRTADNAEPGSHVVTLQSGHQTLRVPVSVQQVDADGNLARTATPSASSSHGNFPPCGAVDGDRSQEGWDNQVTGWNDGTKGQFPDWFQVTFTEPEPVGVVEVITRGSDRAPAPEKGLRDYDVQVLVDGDWVTTAQVRGNEQEVIRSTFAPVTTTAVRLLITATNDGRSRIVELEVYSG